MTNYLTNYLFPVILNVHILSTCDSCNFFLLNGKGT